MVLQHISLPEWDWDGLVFYETVPEDAGIIIAALKMAGCFGEDLERARANVTSGKPDTGLTYTDRELRNTVMVIGHTTSGRQLWNTLDHEKGHMAEHIADALDIDRRGEEYQYLKGAIAQEMYPVAKKLLCERCRGKD